MLFSQDLYMYIFSPVARVGLESTFYSVSRGINVVEVCTIVYSPNISCPINFAFNVSLLKIVDSFLDGNAGNTKQSSHTEKF